MSNTPPTTPQGTPLPPQGVNVQHPAPQPGQPQVPAGVPTSAPAPASASGEKPKRRAPHVPQGRVVNSIPPAQKQSRWDKEMEALKQRPAVVMCYEDVSQTTPSYLKETYGVVAAGRNTRNGRVDMYVYYDPEQEPLLKKDKSKKPKVTAQASTSTPAPTPQTAPST